MGRDVNLQDLFNFETLQHPSEKRDLVKFFVKV